MIVCLCCRENGWKEASSLICVVSIVSAVFSPFYRVLTLDILQGSQVFEERPSSQSKETYWGYSTDWF